MAVGVGISDAELRRAVLKIRSLGDAVTKKERQKMLRKGANILRDAARANVPIAAEPYKDGKGNTIQPGFVKEAISVKVLRRSADLFVGIAKKSGILAYWATWLEYGATNRDGSKREGYAYMRRALASTKEAVIAQIIADAKKLFDRKIKELQNK